MAQAWGNNSCFLSLYPKRADFKCGVVLIFHQINERFHPNFAKVQTSPDSTVLRVCSPTGSHFETPPLIFGAVHLKVLLQIQPFLEGKANNQSGFKPPSVVRNAGIRRLYVAWWIWSSKTRYTSGNYAPWLKMGAYLIALKVWQQSASGFRRYGNYPREVTATCNQVLGYYVTSDPGIRCVFACLRPKFWSRTCKHSVVVRKGCWVQDGLWSDQRTCPPPTLTHRLEPNNRSRFVIST